MNATKTSEQITTTQPAKLLYTAKAHTTGGREGGESRTSDGRLDVKFSVPGGPGNGTNPEQLFAAGYAACFENALLRVARERKAPIRESSVTAHVAIGRDAKGFFELAVVMDISVPDRDRAEIEEMVKIAHEEVCPYSRATRGNIEIKLRVI